MCGCHEAINMTSFPSSSPLVLELVCWKPSVPCTSVVMKAGVEGEEDQPPFTVQGGHVSKVAMSGIFGDEIFWE